MPPIFHSIPDLCRSLGICRSKIYIEIAAGKLKITKFGRRTLVHRDDLEVFVAGLRKAGKASEKAA
ncbi:MAG: helix-turn-helix domain-containing protein [Proteobacteria bacterium]|nr:helix-turn-helix domain-containing protein [Pseudomonadota bacterium]